MSYRGPKLFIVGWDGASFSYIKPWLDEGRMPNFARLLEGSAVGVLKSVIPPQTPVAWPCISTGMNPGKIGIYGWWGPDHNTYNLIPSSAATIRVKRIWDLISDAGMVVGVVNVPMTYPPTAVNGFQIAGFDSPLHEPDFTQTVSYPSHLLDDLRAAGLDYKILITEGAQGVSGYDRLLEAWIAMEKTRTEALLYLVERYQPEFVIVQHHILDYFHHRAPRTSSLLARAHECMDWSLGRYLEKCNGDTNVLVISDHGAIEIEKFVFIHNWLEKEGFLHFHEIADEERLIEILKALTGPAPESTEWLAGVSRLWRTLPLATKRRITAELRKLFPGCNRSHGNIDWANTAVFSVSNYGQLYVNAIDSFAHGTVKPGTDYEEVIRAATASLKRLHDPETGHPIVACVVHRDEVYHGPERARAPDLACVLADYRYYFCMPYSLHLNHNEVIGRVDEYVKEAEHSFVGDHDEDGIFVAAGPNIRPQNISIPMSILDVAPTALYTLNVPIPADLDGRVIEEVFTLFSVERAQRCGGWASIGEISAKETYSSPSAVGPEEIAAIREKLKLLGYRIT